MNVVKFFSLNRYSWVRCALFLIAAFVVALLINRGIYHDFYEKKLLKLHTADLKAVSEQMTTKLNFFMDRGDREAIQNILDSNFGLFGFVVTDCGTDDRLCPDQRIIYTADRKLPWFNMPTVQELSGNPYAILRRLPQVVASPLDISPNGKRPGEILGRLYVLKNMPRNFGADYRSWLVSPFRDIGARGYYLRTLTACLLVAAMIWFMLEFYFGFRRSQAEQHLRREEGLRQTVDTYLRQLTEKDSQLTRLNQAASRQHENYVAKIRSLELKIQNEEEYRELAEQIIAEMEEAQGDLSRQYGDELAKTRAEMARLQQKVEEFESAGRMERESSYKALEKAVQIQFSNTFEQRIYELLTETAGYARGEWRLLKNFDVAVGRNYRQFTDFILINRDCLVILEAKYYPGLIDSPGDFLNDTWYSNGSGRKKIDCLWGENPYHQLNEYSMSLMKLLKQRSPWPLQIFGVIVFPDEADISKVGEHLGKFYRVTTVAKLVKLLENIHEEARRFQESKNPKRPLPEQVEHMLRGRKVVP